MEKETRRNFLKYVGASSLAGILGCVEIDNNTFESCPSEYDVLNTSENYGLLNSTGRSALGFGHYRLGENPSYFPVDHCGFQIYRGHEGGSGDTLEMLDNLNDIYLKWNSPEPDNPLKLFELSVGPKWKGRSNTNLVIGASNFENFSNACPNATLAEDFWDNEFFYGYRDAFNIWVPATWAQKNMRAQFDENGILYSMGVVIGDIERHPAFPDNIPARDLPMIGVEEWQP